MWLFNVGNPEDQNKYSRGTTFHVHSEPRDLSFQETIETSRGNGQFLKRTMVETMGNQPLETPGGPQF